MEAVRRKFCVARPSWREPARSEDSQPVWRDRTSFSSGHRREGIKIHKPASRKADRDAALRRPRAVQARNECNKTFAIRTDPSVRWTRTGTAQRAIRTPAWPTSDLMRIQTIVSSAALLCAALAVNPLSAADVATTTSTGTTNASPTRTKDNVEFVIGPVYGNAPELTI